MIEIKQASGMKLAVPTSGSENSAVYSNWNGNNFGYWIGVTDSASEGNFADVDGNAITYNNWQNGGKCLKSDSKIDLSFINFQKFFITQFRSEWWRVARLC